MSSQNTSSIQLRGYSLSELARMYQISEKSFRTWIKPFTAEIGERHGRYYNVNQVKIILEKLGFPDTLSEMDLVAPIQDKPSPGRPKTA